jgi:hypothetical protein
MNTPNLLKHLDLLTISSKTSQLTQKYTPRQQGDVIQHYLKNTQIQPSIQLGPLRNHTPSIDSYTHESQSKHTQNTFKSEKKKDTKNEKVNNDIESDNNKLAITIDNNHNYSSTKLNNDIESDNQSDKSEKLNNDIESDKDNQSDKSEKVNNDIESDKDNKSDKNNESDNDSVFYIQKQVIHSDSDSNSDSDSDSDSDSGFGSGFGSDGL